MMWIVDSFWPAYDSDDFWLAFPDGSIRCLYKISQLCVVWFYLYIVAFVTRLDLSLDIVNRKYFREE